MHNKKYKANILYFQDTHFINVNIQNNNNGLAMFTMEISQKFYFFKQIYDPNMVV